MTNQQKLPKPFAEKASRIKAAYERFLTALEALKSRRRDLVRRMTGRIEQEQIKKIRDSLN
jgi:hypothetical protein